MNWLPRLTLLYVDLLFIGAGCEEAATFAGYRFSAIQSPDNSLTISAAAVTPSGSTTYTDVIFPSVRLPSQTCGDQYARCHVTIHYEAGDPGTRVAALVAVGDGAAVALFDRETSNLNFIEQYFIPLPGTPNCALTTFIADGAMVYGLCYEFVSDEEVIVQVFIIFLDFGTLSRSIITSHIGRDTGNRLYISEAFHSTCSGATFATVLYWYGNAFLYSLRIDIVSPLNSVDTNISQCFDNGTQQVVLFQDRYILAYCESNTVEVGICDSGVTAPVVNSTTFYCSGRRDTFLEVGAGYLSLNENVIPFPLDLSLPYVGDCVEINGNFHFIGSSVDGTIALTNVLQNFTTILSTDSIVNHQVIDNRFILYSSSTSSTLLDLSCPEPSTPIHVSNVSFELSAFSANSEFSCFTVQPTQAPTTAAIVSTDTTDVSDFTEATTGSSAIQPLSGGAIVGIVVGIGIVIFVGTVATCILCKYGRKKGHFGVTTRCVPVSISLNHTESPLLKSAAQKPKATESFIDIGTAPFHQSTPLRTETNPSTVTESAERKLQPLLGATHDTSEPEENTPATQQPQEPSIVTPPPTERTPPTGTELAELPPRLGATPNTFIPNGIPKLDLHVAPAQEESTEINSSAYLTNPHYQGTDLNPVDDDIQRQNSKTSEENSVTVVAAEPAQPDESNDQKAEIVTNDIPRVPTMRTSTLTSSRTFQAVNNNPSTNYHSRAPEGCAFSPVDVSQAGQRGNECHMTEPGVELLLKSNSFHYDQLQRIRESREQPETSPARASTDPQCSSPPPPRNLINTDHSDSQEPDNERI